VAHLPGQLHPLAELNLQDQSHGVVLLERQVQAADKLIAKRRVGERHG
jgi:hypothetical protein